MEEEYSELVDRFGNVKYMTRQQVAEYLEVDNRVVTTLLLERELEYSMIGRTKKIKLKVLAEYLSRKDVK